MRRIIRFLIGLLGTVGAIQALGQTPVPIAVTGNLTSILGAGQAYAGVSIQLLNCAAPVSIPSYSVIVQQGYQVQADPSGMVNTTVWPNDIISCNGTLGTNKYQLSYVVNGAVQGTPQCYQVLHTQIWNLNTQQPISCDGSAPNPGNFPGLPSGSIQFANGLAFSGSDTSLDTQGNAIIPKINGVPNLFSCAQGINAPTWCTATINCADIGNPSWCNGSPVSPAASTVWLANAIKQLPLQTLGDGVSTVHSGEVDFGPLTWLHIGQPPTEAYPSGSPLFLNGNVTLDCKGGGFIVDGPLGLSDSWIGNGNIPSNVTRHKIQNCTFFDAYDAPTTPVVSEQTYPFDYNGHLANTVDWIVGSTAAFVKNSRVLCEGCLNGLIVGFKTNHNPSSISAITDSTHMTTLTLGQNVAPWTETATAAFPITVSNASAGNTQYCESVSLGNVTNWPGQHAVLSGFTNSANNSPTLGFTVVSAALNCFTVNNAAGVFESNTTGAMANVVPPLITDAITYTGTVGTPWVVTAPDVNGNQTYVGPNINEAYSGFSTDGKQVILAGFHNSANNGTFDISGSLSGPAGQSLIAVYNPSGVAETGQTEDQSATAVVHLAQMKGDSSAFFMGGDPLGVNAGPNNYAAQWSLDNVSTNQTTVGSTAHKFNFALEIGGNNTYIGDVSHFHLAGSRLAPLFAPAGVSNTGENISFTDGSFGASDYACIFHDGNPEFHFYGVSTDYCNHTTHGWKPGNGHVIYGFAPNITWDGGHWESNTPTWYTEWGTSRGYLYASHMVFTSNDANITIPAMFTLRGTRDFIKIGGWLRSDPSLFVTAWTDSPVGIISSFNHDDVYTTAQNVANLPYRERGIEGSSFNSVSGINTVTLFFQASAGDTLSINPYPGYTTPTVLTAVASGASGNQFNLGADAAGTMTNLAAVANASVDANLSKNTYSSSGAVLTITPKTPGMLEAITVTDPNLQWRVGSAVASQPQQARTLNNVSIQSGVNENMKTTGITTTADIQPVMAAGQTTSKFFGRDEDTYNGVYYDFSYTDDKNAANYFAMRLAGPSELQSFALASGSRVRLPQILSAAGLGTDPDGNIVATSGGSTAFSALTAGTNTTAAMVVGSGANLAPTGSGTIQATNISGTVAAGSGIGVTGSGTTGSPYSIAVTGSTTDAAAGPMSFGLPQQLLNMNGTGAALTHDSNSWDSHGIGSPSNVIFINGQYWTCTGGYSSASMSSGQAIGCAYGQTPHSFTMYSGNPVFQNTSPPAWSAACIEGPMLYTDGTNVWMFYNGYSSACDSEGTGQIGALVTTVASFPAGWSAAPSSPTIAQPGGMNWLYRPSVASSGSTFYAFANGGDASNVPIISCFTASAPAGPWTFVSAATITPTQSWEAGHELQEPQVWQDGGGEWIMSYGANGSIGLASNPTLGCSGWLKNTPDNRITVTNVSDTNLPRFSRDAEGNYWMLTATNNSTAIQQAMPVVLSAFVNPMTTLGDVIYGGASGVPTRLAGPTTNAHQFALGWAPSGSAIAPAALDLGTYLGANITAALPIVATPSTLGTQLSCPTCAASSGTAVNVNGGSTLGTSTQNGLLPYKCADTSGSGTVQSCSTTPSQALATGNCFTYSTTTANSGTGLTVAVNGGSALNVAVASSAGWTTTLIASPHSVPANEPMLACYDGTNLNLSSTGVVASASGGVGVIASTTLGAPAATITFAAIPGTYTNLRMVFNAQTSNGSQQDMIVQFNADTGTDYKTTVTFSNIGGGTVGVTSKGTTLVACSLPASSTNVTGAGEMIVPNYTSTTFAKKAINATCTTNNSSDEQILTFGGYWNTVTSAAAITQIVLSLSSGNFTTGSTVTLYGMQ